MKKITLTNFEPGTLKLVHTADSTNITANHNGEAIVLGSYNHQGLEKDMRMDILKKAIIIESDMEHAIENHIKSIKIPTSTDDLQIYFGTRDYKINRMYSKAENKKAILNSYQEIKVDAPAKPKKNTEDDDEKNDDIEKLHRERNLILKQQMKEKTNLIEKAKKEKEHERKREDLER